MKIEQTRDLTFFQNFNMWDNEYQSYVIPDSTIETLETEEELKKAFERQKLNICDLMSKERELIHHKELALRSLVILEEQYTKLRVKRLGFPKGVLNDED